MGKLLPFEFRGEVRETPSYVDLALLEAAARRRQTFRPMSYEEQQRQAKAAQAEAGIRVRIERPVSNYSDFVPQMAAWYRQEAEGTVARRKLGRAKGRSALHMTVLDTGDQNELLGHIDDSLSLEDVTRKLTDRLPSLFRNTGRIAYTEPKLLGPRLKPWVALPISPASASIHDEYRAVRQIIAPNCEQGNNIPHTSLGDVTVYDAQKIDDTFEMLKQGIVPLLPGYIMYGPAVVTLSQNSRQ